MMGQVERRVQDAIQCFEEEEICLIFRPEAARAAREVAAVVGSQQMMFEFSNDAMVQRLCHEISDDTWQEEGESWDITELLVPLRSCNRCQFFDAGSMGEQDWLVECLPASDYPDNDSVQCGHKAIHQRIYPNCDIAEVDGSDRRSTDADAGYVSMWRGLRQSLFAEFVLAYADLTRVSDSRVPDRKQELLDNFRDDQSTFEAVMGISKGTAATSDSLPNASLRFGVGDVVVCSTGDSWQRGRVIKLWYREFGWPSGEIAPYQVELDSGDTIYAPNDRDTCIRSAATLDLQPGRRVRLAGLQTQSLNGKTGTVLPFRNFEEEMDMTIKGRLPVRIDGEGSKALKVENLESIS